MFSLTTLTPYYAEDVIYSRQALDNIMEGGTGVSVLYYLMKVYPDEWVNFLQRIGAQNEKQAMEDPMMQKEVCRFNICLENIYNY